MRLVILFALAAILAGCAAIPGPVQEVKVPVPVYCDPPEVARPLFAVDSLPIGASVWDQMKALRAERKQREGYEAELEAAVSSCASSARASRPSQADGDPPR